MQNPACFWQEAERILNMHIFIIWLSEALETGGKVWGSKFSGSKALSMVTIENQERVG